MAARAKSDLLLTRHRRARSAGDAAHAHNAINTQSASTVWDRMNQKVNRTEAIGQARAELLGDSVEDRFAAMEKQDEIERLLASLKTRA
jgi:phage shock protein A